MRPVVLHFTSERTWRGGEVQVFLQLKHQSHKIRSVLACPPDTELASRARGLGIDTEAVNVSNGIDLFAAWRLKKICRQRGIDIVHCHAPKAHGVAFISRLLGNKAKIIATKRTIFPIKNNFFSRLKYRALNAVVCISPEVAEAVLSAANVPTKVVPSMVDHLDYEPVKWPGVDAVLAEKKIVGYVAAMTSEKDPDTFLKVAREVTDRSPDTHFVWLGDGPLRPTIEQGINSLGLRDRVHLLGFKEEILNWISALDVFFFPSLAEGLGTSVLQALHCKVPVVVSSVGGLKSLVEHESNGLAADPGDVLSFAEGIVRLLDDPELSQRLVTAGAAKVQTFYPGQITKQLEQLYTDLSQEVS